MTLEQAQTTCPKHMYNGPCGGVRLDNTCEVNHQMLCPYVQIANELPWRHPPIKARASKTVNEGRLERTLRAGKFAITAEAYTPDTSDLSDLIKTYEAFKGKITAVNIAEHALATPHASTLAAAALFERAGIEAIINLTCRDRNRIGLQGEILGASALGVKNIFCVTGDHPALGDHPEAKAVFDLDALQLVSLVKRLRDDGELLSGRKLESKPKLFIGAAANPFSPPVSLQAERVAAKVAAGADFIQTQAVFDLASLQTFIEGLESFGVFEHTYLMVGVAVVTGLEQALWLQREVPGARVPDQFIERLRGTPEHQRRAEGVMYALELIQQLEKTTKVHGALLFPLHGDVSSLAEVLGSL
jgi:methylenetetrahydrofolate reductase (NADPH)